MYSLSHVKYHLIKHFLHAIIVHPEHLTNFGPSTKQSAQHGRSIERPRDEEREDDAENAEIVEPVETPETVETTEQESSAATTMAEEVPSALTMFRREYVEHTENMGRRANDGGRLAMKKRSVENIGPKKCEKRAQVFFSGVVVTSTNSIQYTTHISNNDFFVRIQTHH